jgi:NAD(P)H-nitrite reductase large subunit
VVSKEDSLPYDRTLLSKALASGDADKWTLRPKEFLDTADIDFKLGRNSNVYNVLPESKEVILVSG